MTLDDLDAGYGVMMIINYWIALDLSPFQIHLMAAIYGAYLKAENSQSKLLLWTVKL